MEPGTFVRALLEAFRTADHLNQARLATGFPSYYLAVRTLNAGGPEALRGIAAELREHQRVGAQEEARAAYRGRLGEVAAAQEVLAAETGEQLEDVFSLAVDVVNAIEAERRRTGPVWLEEHFIPRSEVSVMLGAVRQLWDFLQGPVAGLIDQASTLIAPDPAIVDWPLGPELTPAAMNAVHDVLERYGLSVTDPLAAQLMQELAAARLVRDHDTEVGREAMIGDPDTEFYLVGGSMVAVQRPQRDDNAGDDDDGEADR
jgi:hypothetical protein